MFLINGSPGDRISAEDRGLHYGDGLFETIAVVDGRPLCWDRHVARLAAGCLRLAMPMPAERLLETEAERLCAGNGRGVLKIIVTRGSGGRGYLPPAEPCVTRILGLYDWPDHPQGSRRHGVQVHVCDTRLGMQPALAGLKHLNRLEQVLARQEVQRAGADEGLMLDPDGCVIEGTTSNLFLIDGNRLLTPDLRRCGVAGIVRGLILERASQWSLRPVVTDILPAQVTGAEEVFLTNSIIGIWPVRRIGEQEFAPGQRTAQIARELEAASEIAPA
jgi:4-amino-4-deoxychorismate lyase